MKRWSLKVHSSKPGHKRDTGDTVYPSGEYLPLLAIRNFQKESLKDFQPLEQPFSTTELQHIVCALNGPQVCCRNFGDGHLLVGPWRGSEPGSIVCLVCQ